MHLKDRVPDAKTVWLFRERLKPLGLVDVLFARFDEQLAQRGYVAKAGQMILNSSVSHRQKPSNSWLVWL